MFFIVRATDLEDWQSFKFYVFEEEIRDDPHLSEELKNVIRGKGDFNTLVVGWKYGSTLEGAFRKYNSVSYPTYFRERFINHSLEYFLNHPDVVNLLTVEHSYKSLMLEIREVAKCL